MGATFAGTVIGSDTAFDIAVIGIDAGSNLPTVALGTASTLKVGEPLVVIGNPYGLNQTLTTGIVLGAGSTCFGGAGHLLPANDPDERRHQPPVTRVDHSSIWTDGWSA